MNVGGKYRFIGILDKANYAGFGPWNKGGECEGKVVEVQSVVGIAGNFPITIALCNEDEVEWPDNWSPDQRRFAVSKEELRPLETKPIDHWR